MQKKALDAVAQGANEVIKNTRGAAEDVTGTAVKAAKPLAKTAREVGAQIDKSLPGSPVAKIGAGLGAVGAAGAAAALRRRSKNASAAPATPPRPESPKPDPDAPKAPAKTPPKPAASAVEDVATAPGGAADAQAHNGGDPAPAQAAKPAPKKPAVKKPTPKKPAVKKPAPKKADPPAAE
ncbi:hypothetical protein BH10ACT11_BH10ACT11_14670 [soil metagenome]